MSGKPHRIKMSATSAAETPAAAVGAPVEAGMWLTDETGQMYVTVDTGQHSFPEVNQQQQQPLVALDKQPTEQQVLKALGSIEPVAPAQQYGMAAATNHKLDALANAASAQMPISNEQQQQQQTQVIVNGRVFPPGNAVPLPQRDLPQLQQQHQLICGDCSSAFPDGDVLFQHWLERHCKPSEQVPAAAAPPSIELEQCGTCNHVFVRGTDRFEEHRTRCAAEKAQQRQQVAATLPGVGSKRKSDDSDDAGLAKVAKAPVKKPTSSSSSSMVSCGICSVDVKTITSFFLHWLDAHHEITEVLQEVWQCGQCRPNKLFPSSPRLSEHVGSAHPFRRNVYQCAEDGCGAKYASMPEAESHQRQVHFGASGGGAPSSCARCGAYCGDGASADGAHLRNHFATEHEEECSLCGCQVDSEATRAHLAREHMFEIVWNRSDSLSRITVSTADGDDASLTGDSRPKSNKKHQNKIQISPTSAEPSAAPTTTTPGQQTPTATPTNPTTAAPPASASLSKCTACGQLFTSEKLLEKHYFANHEFQCKFCDLKMDKDVYGDHLRAHLASERKRTGAASAAAGAASSRSK